jgi:hypothetical protein
MITPTGGMPIMLQDPPFEQMMLWTIRLDEAFSMSIPCIVAFFTRNPMKFTLWLDPTVRAAVPPVPSTVVVATPVFVHFQASIVSLVAFTPAL